jgi:hypothetical protein
MTQTTETRRAVAAHQIHRLVDATRDGRAEDVQAIVAEFSRRHRYLSPILFALDALAMLFEGVKLLATNWRLTLIQLLPAMWIWAAMIDLKVHVLHGKSFHVVRGPVLLALAVVVVLLTASGYFLNAVFAFAISTDGPPVIATAFAKARRHWRSVLGFGAAVGAALAFSTLVTPRWGRPWFTISLSIVIGLMMVSYVAVPARMIGIPTGSTAKDSNSRRDSLTAAAIGGALGAVVCSPPYLLARLGLVLLGSSTLFFLGVVLLTIGFVLYAGATSAVKTIKVSAKLVASQRSEPPGAREAPSPK